MLERSDKTKDLFWLLMFLAWFFLGATLLAIPIIIVAFLTSGLSYVEFIDNTQLVTTCSYIAAIISHILGIILFIILYKQIIKNDATNFKTKWWKYIIIIVVGFVLLYTSNILLNLLYDALGFEGETSQNQQSIIDALNGTTKYLVIIYTVVLAPIFEEIIYRKLFYTVLKKFTNLKPWAIVLIISAIFAFIHVCSDFESLKFFPQYFVLAIIITTSYAITKENIFVSTGLHFLNNLVAVIEIII